MSEPSIKDQDLDALRRGRERLVAQISESQRTIERSKGLIRQSC
jgi:hypothetical protein